MDMLHSTLLTPTATFHNKRQFKKQFISLFFSQTNLHSLSYFQKHKEAHFVQINKHDGKLSQSEAIIFQIVTLQDSQFFPDCSVSNQVFSRSINVYYGHKEIA